MDGLAKFVPLGCVQATSVATATALPGVGSPAAVPNGPNVVALIVPEATGFRYRDDGTNPTTAVGIPLAAGVPFLYSGDLTKIRVIQQATGAILNVSYYRQAG